MKQRGASVVGARVPRYLKKNIAKVKDEIGICRACKHGNVPKEVVFPEIFFRIIECNKSKLPCHLTRDNMLRCDHFEEPKARSIFDSAKSLSLAFLQSIKEDNWTTLKKAIRYELQN